LLELWKNPETNVWAEGSVIPAELVVAELLATLAVASIIQWVLFALVVGTGIQAVQVLDACSSKKLKFEAGLDPVFETANRNLIRSPIKRLLCIGVFCGSA